MMISKVNKAVLAFLILVIMLTTGCWNYREVEQLAIVAGVALDKNEDGTLQVTVETVDIRGGTQGTYEPEYIEIEGESLFESNRRAIAIGGKRLYWSHAKAIILSKELAEEDISKYLDFLFRDQEAREDIWILVSKDSTAREVLQSTSKFKNIVAFEIDDTMRSQRSLSRFPNIELYEFFDRMFYTNVSPVLPAVCLEEQAGGAASKVGGTAIFKNNKLVGFLSEKETRNMLWLRDEVEGGFYVVDNVMGEGNRVTLEIHKSKSGIKPIIEDDVLKMKADIRIDVFIVEISGGVNVIENPGREILIKKATESIKADIMSTYKKVQDEYKADIFGFGREIDMHMPYVWNEIKNDWDERFQETELVLNADIRVNGTATTRLPLPKGEK
ncbi:MAG: germination protein Ger(X)C family [Clostridia bacterium]|nr:germination protein Ger(X)C family [Clostridia bacterium]